MTLNRKKGRITLDGLFPVAKYMGAAFVAICLPRLPGQLWLLPGLTASRAWLLVWVAVLLGSAMLMDRAWIRAYHRDLIEIRNKVKNGNLNRSTLLALGVPLLFLADLAAIAHLYLCLYHSGMTTLTGQMVNLATGLMAAGMVLWIYGQLLPRIPFGSIWGIRTAKTMADQQTWGLVHLVAVRWVCLAGAVLMILGAFI